MKNLKFTGTLILVAVATAGIVSCSKKGSAADSVAAADSTNLAKVTVLKAEIRDVEQRADFTTTVLPDAKNSIAPQSPTRIRKIFVEVGDRVVKGQKLVQLDATSQAALKTQVDNLTTSYKRMSELFAVGGASQQDLDNVKVQLDVAETQLHNANENTYLTSPLNGIVTARNYDDGDLFNGQLAVLTVMQINPLKLKINISESYYAKIKKGMGVNVAFDALAGELFTGNINLIYPVIDEMTRTFTAEVVLPNANGKIRPGMYGRVTLNLGKEKSVVISDKSVVKQQGTDSRYVYVLNADNTVSYKKVELGTRIGNEYAVLSGVEEGEQVVVDGLAGLVDGKKVLPIHN
ncbi:MAG: efflux RND transporter periplasmic adaptor subunit [Dysgonamonadaceae bacterium]|jgi:RND family efflux transporter MFP subunit|nr:efflux RND transporter periplasmic adaptor subunit [Dysgonamonadaceae bacterium]